MIPDKKVILLGIDTPIGLTIIRELGAHGVCVFGIGRSRRALGRYSRFLYKGFTRPSDEKQAIGFIAQLAADEKVPFVMAISELDILMIQHHAGELGNLKPLVPPREPFSVVIDKERTLRIAREIGIDTPDSRIVSTFEEIEPLVNSIEYPVVLKWANPAEVGVRLAEAGRPFRKAEYCYGPDDLKRALFRYKDIGTFPLVQSFCPGYGVGHMVFMHEGRPILEFQHRRIAEWPPEGGFSVVCESLEPENPSPPVSKSVKLLRRIGWVGPAMVEYRYDPRTDRAVLMEVNGRFWGSLPLAYHARAHFAWLTYSVLGMGHVPEIPTVKVGVRCRFVWPEIKRLLRILFKPQDIQDRQLRFNRLEEVLAFVLRFASPRSRYYVFSLRDPGPFFMDIFLSATSRLLPR